MSRVIKKTIESDEPVIIEKKPKKNLSENKIKEISEIQESLDFTQHIRNEIDHWREKLARQIASRTQAQSRLHKQKMEQAYREGYKKGVADGIDRERSDRIKAIDTLLSEARKKNEKAIRGFEIKVIDLATAISEKIIRKSIEVAPALVEDIVAETMSHIIGSETAILKVSPEDFKTINAKYDKWLGMSGSTREFRIEIDKRLRAGDCIVETEGGIVDGVISDRIDVLVEELLKVSG